MDDVIKSRLILQENVNEENEKIKEEDEKNKTTEIILNERMSLNTHRNLSLINRAKLKILKDNFHKNRNRNNTTSNENIESPKKEKEGIFFTEPNIPIKNNISQNISNTEENTYKNFIKNTINKIQKQYPSYNMLSHLFVDLSKITLKERNKLKAFKKKKFTLPPILNIKSGRNNKPIHYKNNTINIRNINSNNIISTITIEENINNKIINSDVEN